MITKISISVVALSLLVGLAYAGVGGDIGSIDYGYSGANGPSNWCTLKPAYSLCATGKEQSPVNIKTLTAVPNINLKPFTMNYVDAVNATLINFGSSIGLNSDGNVGNVEIDDKKYNFSQMHWHTPSEHLLNGKRYAAELHLVHVAEDKSIAVVGILFEIGNPDPLLAQLEDGLKKLTTVQPANNNGGPKIPVGMLSTKDIILPKANKYYRYDGSLTTPPCTEHVKWSLFNQVRTISPEQVEALKAALAPGFKENARPEQPINDRWIKQVFQL